MGLLGNTVSSLFTSAATIPLGLFIGIILARYLSVDERGVCGVVVSMSSLFAVLSQLGWSVVPIHSLRSRNAPPAHVAAASLLMTTLLSALAVAICMWLRPTLTDAFLKGAPPWAFYFALALVPFQLVALIFRAVARGIDRFVLQNGHLLAVRVATLVGLSLALIGWGGGLLAALIALLGAEIIAALGLLVAVVHRTGLVLRPDLRELRAGVRFGLKSHLPLLAGQIHERVDVFMIAALLEDPAQVAFYVVATGTLFQAKLVPESIGMALFPALAGLEEKEAGRLAARVSRHSLFWTVLAVVALGVAAPLLLPLFYGPDYSASVGPFRILLPAMVTLTVYRVLARYFTALGRQEVNLATQVVSISAHVLLNLWLIPRFGIAGAAIGSSLAYGLEAVVITLAFRHRSGQRLRDIFVLRRSDVEEYRHRWLHLGRGGLLRR